MSYKKKDRIGHYLQNKRISAVLPHVKGKVLDIGCGTNEFKKHYHGETVGIDVFDWGGADLIVKDSSKLPYPDKSFDTITFIACIGHIINYKEVLKEANRLLRDDGKIIITSPPFSTRFWHRLRKRSDPDQIHRGIEKGETLGFTYDRMKEVLSETGFQIQEYKKFVFRLNRLFIGTKQNSQNVVKLEG